MNKLQERILSDGIVVDNDILKVDTFINNQVDPELMTYIGNELANHFKDKGITKVITIESSGIAPALMTAIELNVPLVILKKHQSKILNDNLYQTEVTSYTTGNTYELTLAADVINADDHVLVIDDFLADGEAATGSIRLIRMAHATVAGFGIVIEKSFQPGHQKLRDQGFDVYSLARIQSMNSEHITFIEE